MFKIFKDFYQILPINYLTKNFLFIWLFQIKNDDRNSIYINIK